MSGDDSKCTFRYCDFFSCDLDGKPMNDGSEPHIFGEFNVAWPRGWSLRQAERYRHDHGLLLPDGGKTKEHTNDGPHEI